MLGGVHRERMGTTCGDRARLVMEPRLCHRVAPEVEEEGWSDGVALRVSQEDRPLSQLLSSCGATGQNSPSGGMASSVLTRPRDHPHCQDAWPPGTHGVAAQPPGGSGHLK